MSKKFETKLADKRFTFAHLPTRDATGQRVGFAIIKGTFIAGGAAIGAGIGERGARQRGGDPHTAAQIGAAVGGVIGFLLHDLLIG